MRIESGALINENQSLRLKLEAALRALKFYESGGHYKILDGKTAIVDTGGIAEDAIAVIQNKNGSLVEGCEYLKSQIEHASFEPKSDRP